MNNEKCFKVYQASAGSGKTYTIVKEFLGLCLKDPHSVNNFSHILAITFTNMASSDMKRKIIVALHDIIDKQPSDELSDLERDLMTELQITRETLQANAKVLFSKIIHDYSSFNISTIDSFVQKIARSFSKELNVPLQYNVSIDETGVIDHVVEEIGNQIGDNDALESTVLRGFYSHAVELEEKVNFEERLRGFIRELFTEAAYKKVKQNKFKSTKEFQDSIQFIHMKTKDFAPACKVFVDDFKNFLTKYNLHPEDFNGQSKSVCLSFYNNLRKKSYKMMPKTLEQIVGGEKTWYNKTLKKNEHFEEIDAYFSKHFLPFYQKYQAEYPSYDFYSQQGKMLYVYALSAIIREIIERYIQEEQIVPLSEFNKRINAIMGDFSVPFIYERIGERFYHVFIDEFQDTSILQWQNLLPLIDNSLSNHNLNMVVGDGKQSIYRWRSGEIGQIIELPKIFGKPDDSPFFDEFENNLQYNFNFKELKCNYRSFANIVRFNNKFFSRCFTMLSDEWKRVYFEENGAGGKSVSIEQEIMKKHDGFVQVEEFAINKDTIGDPILERIPAIVEDLLAHGFKLSDIAILTRKNKEGTIIANFLSERGYAVQSLESMLLRSSNRVQLLISTLDYLIHDTNEIAIANVIFYWKATHYPLSSDMLSGLLVPVKKIATKKEHIEDSLEMKAGTLNALLSQSYSLYDLCSALVREYHFNSITDPYLNFFLDIVHKWQSSNKSSIQSFLEFWEEKQMSLSIESESNDAIRILTVHKSKGLEFNVVIYPYANNNIEERKEVTQWRTAEELGFESIPNIDNILYSFSSANLSTPQINQLYKEEIERVKLDNMNLLYVAFTRPKQRLYILTEKTKSEKTEKNAIKTFLLDQQEHINHAISTPDKHTVYQFGDPDSQKVPEKQDNGYHTLTIEDSEACDWFNKIEMDPQPSMFWVHPDEKMNSVEWGIFIHQVLSQIQTEDDIDKALKPALDKGIIDEVTATTICSTIHQITQHPLVNKAFSPNAHVKNECDILSKDHKIHRPDRFAEVDGTIYLLDYKTGKENPEHHQQLQEYASLLKEMTPLPIRCYLVYLNPALSIVEVTTV